MTEKTLPFQFDGWDDVDTLTINHYKVNFTKDFGVFKQGETHSCIAVNFVEGWMEAYDEDGTVAKLQTFSFCPTDEA